MDAEVAVVIVTYDSAAVVGDLLDSLPGAARSCTTSVMVVDNGSTDRTVQLLEERADVTVVRSTNRGYAAGINLGVESSPPSEAVLVLNPDVRLAPGSIDVLLETMRTTGAGLVAPRVLETDGEVFRSLRREPTLRRAAGLAFLGHPALSEYVTEPEAYARRHPVDWALGAVLLVSRACHDAIGGWDESYFLYSEETDLCLRARDAGWQTWYEPMAVATHIGGGSGQSGATHAMQIVNRVRLYARRHGRGRAVPYYALVLASELSWMVRGETKSRASIRALLRPSTRSPALGCSDSLIPR